MDSSNEQPGGDSTDGYPGQDYTPIYRTMLDRYGRRSRAWHHKTSSKMIAETAISEATTTYRPQIKFFRRQDNMNCLEISVFGGIRNRLIKEIVGLLFLPVMVAYAGYAYLMFRWDAWRAGPYRYR